jgi:hypothetical protein
MGDRRAARQNRTLRVDGETLEEAASRPRDGKKAVRMLRDDERSCLVYCETVTRATRGLRKASCSLLIVLQLLKLGCRLATRLRDGDCHLRDGLTTQRKPARHGKRAERREGVRYYVLLGAILVESSVYAVIVVHTRSTGGYGRVLDLRDGVTA